MNNNLIKVCKIGYGSACCKYLVVGHQGFECMKTDATNKATIDKNWETVSHVAQGDNCEGKPIDQLN